tara:strand:- start:921 stop:1772 length:852 start_codon:yes stop_codon:yes gene_type:complete
MSRFNGNMWSDPEVLQNTEGVSDFDPAFIRTREKIFFFYSNASWFEPKLHHDKVGFLGTFFCCSEDDGKTWSKPNILSKVHACKANGICLEKGDLLLPVYHAEVSKVGVFKSTDDGDNWELYESDPIDIDIAEPSLIELTTNYIVMIARTKTGTLWISESMDDGNKWTTPKPTSIDSYNTPVSLLKIDNSLLVCYNCGKLREKLSLCSTGSISFKWDSTVVIDQINNGSFHSTNSIHSSGSDCAVTYPSMINYGVDKIMVAWSSYKINESEHQGEICYCIVKI